MKKIHLIFALVGLIFTMTACSSEENEPIQQANVKFTVNLDNIDSRAISDGTTANQLIFAVFNSDGNELTALRQNDVEIVNRQATVTTSLVKGQTYTFVFWAQHKKDDSLNDNGYYNTTNLKDVIVNYGGEANDEKRDAFTNVRTVTVDGAINEIITLQRPFAQVDFVCDLSEWENLLNSNYKLIGSDLTIDSGAYTHINLLTGEASEPTSIPFTFSMSDYWEHHQDSEYNFCGFISSKPGETYQDLFATTEGDKFWLSMNYVLATPEISMLGHTIMNIYGISNYEATPVKLELDKVPVKRNHRTVVHVSNITKMVSLIIVIDSNFEGDL